MLPEKVCIWWGFSTDVVIGRYQPSCLQRLDFVSVPQKLSIEFKSHDLEDQWATSKFTKLDFQ